jgi:hypothetical protein
VLIREEGEKAEDFDDLHDPELTESLSGHDGIFNAL